MNEHDEWIEADRAADRLNRTERQIYRYGVDRRIRTRKFGRRTQYHAQDVERLAGELGVDRGPRPPKQPRQEIVPPSAMLDYLRERDNQLEQAQREIQRLIYELGQRDQELSNRLLPEDADKIRRERDEYKEQIEAYEQLIDEVIQERDTLQNQQQLLNDVIKERDQLKEQQEEVKKPWWKFW